MKLRRLNDGPLVAATPADLPTGFERAVAIGNFDGVHLGHRSIVEKTRSLGFERTTVVTFAPHPRDVLGRRVAALGTVEQRVELLGNLGVDEVLVIAFDRQIAALSGREWATSVLSPIGTREIVVGDGFRFGHRRSGDVELLRRLGFRVHSLAHRRAVSSTAIRDLIAAGRLREAAEMLGRPYSLEMVVVAARTGQKRTTVLLESVHEEPASPPAGPYRLELAGQETVGLLEGPLRPQAVAQVRAVGITAGRRLRVTFPGAPLPQGGHTSTVDCFRAVRDPAWRRRSSKPLSQAHRRSPRNGEEPTT